MSIFKPFLFPRLYTLHPCTASSPRRKVTFKGLGRKLGAGVSGLTLKLEADKSNND
ncbi:hypothetical protein DPMN_176151 [Dreissena polymorpha]|uniref:Uncharacterized protein n=1 Tax=Dreissena polymorpha TaxID=45954 RepID=A0A9D4IJD6_DREPO|nr:hypothetical protein DPMN_176149 [Dreissena polymorpha]KAH3774757.1 hypothetical protein DPMN_176150 [Dreissena polymorpha]KAH3774758.1 hypothetical protein DPMN_176151 [Dreissena polymorpha]